MSVSAILVSADNSSAFNDMIEAGSGPASIELDDDSTTLRHFLVIAQHRRLDVQGLEAALFARVLALIAFLDKYGCDAALEIALAGIVRRVKDTLWPRLLYFLVGAKLRRPAICHAALDTGARELPEDMQWHLFTPALRPPLAGGGEGVYTLDFRALTRATLDTLPNEYLLPLAASRPAFQDPDAGRRCAAMSFQQCMDHFEGKRYDPPRRKHPRFNHDRIRRHRDYPWGSRPWLRPAPRP